MPLTTDTLIGPAHWASYLINGDDSDMEPEELEAADDWLAANNQPEIVDVARDEFGEAEDPWFTWNYALYGGTAEGGSCHNYIAHWR